MSLNHNYVEIAGRLTQDIDLRSTQSGKFVCGFIVAVDRDYQAQGKERVTDFIPCVAWDKTAEFLSKYFHKGSPIFATGELQTRKYEDKNGNKRTATEVIVSKLKFVESAKTAEQPQAAAQTTFDDDMTLGATSASDDLPF